MTTPGEQGIQAAKQENGARTAKDEARKAARIVMRNVAWELHEETTQIFAWTIEPCLLREAAAVVGSIGILRALVDRLEAISKEAIR